MSDEAGKSRRRPPLTVSTNGPPDLDAAADAMLPLFLAFLAGRAKPAPEGAPHRIEPARTDEEGRSLPPQL